MSDDLFKDCDCGDCGDCDCGDCGDCGDCDCDCDCCDCDCSCDDCLPGNNFILICCCFSSNTQNTNDPNNRTNRTNRTNNTSSSCFPCCCCCCCDDDGPRRRRHERKKKKKGFCCWRLWCCFARKEPSPPPSPRHPRPDDLSFRSYYRRDGRYPMEDPDFYMNDRWARHHDLDMPPRGGGGGRYPIPKEMHMYRDEYYGRGAKWNNPRESTRSSAARSREVNVVPPKHRPDEIVINPDEYEPPFVDNDTVHQGHQLQGNWSKPMKYEEGSAKQTKK